MGEMSSRITAFVVVFAPIILFIVLLVIAKRR